MDGMLFAFFEIYIRINRKQVLHGEIFCRANLISSRTVLHFFRNGTKIGVNIVVVICGSGINGFPQIIQYTLLSGTFVRLDGYI